MTIAYDFLSDLEKAQFKAMTRQSYLMPCQRCGGQVLRNYDECQCLQCGEEHDQNGDLITSQDNTKSHPMHRNQLL